MTARPMAWARHLATLGLRPAWPRRALLRLAGARGRALVLVYHRVSPDGPAAHEIVRSLPSSLFASQLRTLSEMGDIVPLARLLDAAPAPTSAHAAPTAGEGERPRFAITFDDDEGCHRRHVLPVLEELRVPATFFLSGRALHGLGPYWWSLLERSIRARGLEATRRLLGLWKRETTRRSASTPDTDTPADLAVALEGSPLVEQLSRLLDTHAPDGLSPAPSPARAETPPMPAEDIRALAAAGMTIGFHTLRHPVLPTLTPAALEASLSEGRSELAAAAGTAVDLFAYPHGRADASTAAAAKRAGFVAAFAAGGRPITARSDRFLLARWEPGALQGDAFAAAVAARLLRPPTPPR